MNKEDIFPVMVLCFIVIVFGSMMVLITLLMIDGATSEYKYSIDVPCYDKFGNEIYDLMCEKEIHCGAIFKTRIVNGNTYSCDEDIGLIRNSKQRSKDGK